MSAQQMRLSGGRLTIDLAALADNWRKLRDRLGGNCECTAAIKGAGYGIGLEEAAETLARAGCRTFFVALPNEGLRTRAILPDARIYVLDGLLPGTAADYAASNLIPVLGSMPEIEEWAAFCTEQGRQLPAALHIDTGMNRLGLRLDEARALAQRPDLLAAFELTLVMSHLACASGRDHPLNALQLSRFGEIADLYPGVPKSLANSGGIFLGDDYHFDLVRPGIALYGGEAMDDEPNPMRPVVTAEARILTLRDAEPGESVGYGAAQSVERPTRLAILGVGYADGYHRLAGTSSDKDGEPAQSAQVWIGGHVAPIFGRVSMDLIAVDVTDIPPEVCARGAWVELFGPNISVDSVARCARTIGYELLTGLGNRYTRSYKPFEQLDNH